MARLGQKTVDPLERFKDLYRNRYAGLVHRCEQRLEWVTGRPAGILSESCGRTRSAGGKRLRPLLLFLSTRKGTEAGREQELAAAAVELVHMATLVHDDVLDGAALRRGQPTLYASYGKPVSVAAGDYLFASAFELLASAGSTAAVSLLSQASLDLSMGELAQMREAADYDLRPEAYFDRCRLKTSGLFVAACRMGAVLSGCSEPAVAAVGEYARYLGLSFQLADDILDFDGSPAETGKETGTDLRDGTVTLPLILALKRDDGIRPLLGSKITGERVAEICRRVEAAGGIEATRRQALAFADQALASLEPAAEELDIEPLALIAETSVNRRA